jgi:hypothetical protein
MMMLDGYGKEVAEEIFRGAKYFKLDGDGVWLKLPEPDDTADDKPLRWHPLDAAWRRGRPDSTNQPSLPFPFSAKQLAAVLMAGAGLLVAGRFGTLSEGPDESSLSGAYPPMPPSAQDAVREAFAAYKQAVARVDGTPKVRAQLRANRRHAILSMREAATHNEVTRAKLKRAFEAHAVTRQAAEQAEAKWLASVAEELLYGQVSKKQSQVTSAEMLAGMWGGNAKRSSNEHQGSAVTDKPLKRDHSTVLEPRGRGWPGGIEPSWARPWTHQKVATVGAPRGSQSLASPNIPPGALSHIPPAPEVPDWSDGVHLERDSSNSTAPLSVDAHPVAASSSPDQLDATKAPEWDRLATPEALESAFGEHAGLKRAWFSDLDEGHALHTARKVDGKPGRGGMTPMFDVVMVARFLIDGKPKFLSFKPRGGEFIWRIVQGKFPKAYALMTEEEKAAIDRVGFG